jgi:hypothetical protein
VRELRAARSPQGARLARHRVVRALDVEELPTNERPTIPVPAPKESEVRLKVTRIPWIAATVDVVVADLSRDPRSESWVVAVANDVFDEPQNESPPSTSTVRALK